MIKDKTPQKEDIYNVSPRDLFQTPNYAVDLLIPYIPENDVIWECAAGSGKIAKRLIDRHATSAVLSTDIMPPYVPHNFITDPVPINNRNYIIITNPPYSCKKKFIERAIELDKPFAFLIPADYSGFIINCMIQGCQKIVPTRRINFITPTGRQGKASSSDFHSLWLTRYFNLPEREIYVELSLDEIKNNI